MSIRETRANAGEYLMMGKYLDSGEEIFTRILDLPYKASLPDVAYRVMSEIGRLDPERYDFFALLKIEENASRVILTNRMLLQYIRTHWT